ncbi:MAG: type II secretion system protein GspG, partial [Lentisphaerae bacterium]|nr:type II secretion system protein GspG [Lentisphaerota bacterium]
ITVIVAIAAPNLSRAREKSRIRRAEAELEIISAALLKLGWDTGKFPYGIPRDTIGNAETWDLESSVGGLIVSNAALFPNWQGPYLPDVPLDPWGSKYFFDPDYRVAGVFRSVVGSFGPNGQGKNVYDSDNIYVIMR